MSALARLARAAGVEAEQDCVADVQILILDRGANGTNVTRPLMA